MDDNVSRVTIGTFEITKPLVPYKDLAIPVYDTPPGPMFLCDPGPEKKA